MLIVFATNLDPTDLVDEAFLRRIRYKIPIERSDESSSSRAIFEMICEKRAAAVPPGDGRLLCSVVTIGRTAARCAPATRATCSTRSPRSAAIAGSSRTITRELLDAACANYFVDTTESRDAEGAPPRKAPAGGPVILVCDRTQNTVATAVEVRQHAAGPAQGPARARWPRPRSGVGALTLRRDSHRLHAVSDRRGFHSPRRAGGPHRAQPRSHGESPSRCGHTPSSSSPPASSNSIPLRWATACTWHAEHARWRPNSVRSESRMPNPTSPR